MEISQKLYLLQGMLSLMTSAVHKQMAVFFLNIVGMF